jgi:hypothetical protein
LDVVSLQVYIVVRVVAVFVFTWLLLFRQPTISKIKSIVLVVVTLIAVNQDSGGGGGSVRAISICVAQQISHAIASVLAQKYATPNIGFDVYYCLFSTVQLSMSVPFVSVYMYTNTNPIFDRYNFLLSVLWAGNRAATIQTSRAYGAAICTAVQLSAIPIMVIVRCAAQKTCPSFTSVALYITLFLEGVAFVLDLEGFKVFAPLLRETEGLNLVRPSVPKQRAPIHTIIASKQGRVALTTSQKESTSAPRTALHAKNPNQTNTPKTYSVTNDSMSLPSLPPLAVQSSRHLIIESLTNPSSVDVHGPDVPVATVTEQV